LTSVCAPLLLNKITFDNTKPPTHPTNQPTNRPTDQPTNRPSIQMCVNILAMIAGYNIDNIDLTRLPTYLNYTPSGTSVANMAHWCQVGGGGTYRERAGRVGAGSVDRSTLMCRRVALTKRTD
jgi:hypothetical protein